MSQAKPPKPPPPPPPPESPDPHGLKNLFEEVETVKQIAIGNSIALQNVSAAAASLSRQIAGVSAQQTAQAATLTQLTALANEILSVLQPAPPPPAARIEFGSWSRPK